MTGTFRVVVVSLGVVLVAAAVIAFAIVFGNDGDRAAWPDASPTTLLGHEDTADSVESTSEVDSPRLNTDAPSVRRDPRKALDDLLSHYTSHGIDGLLPASTEGSLLPWYPETPAGEKLPELGIAYTVAMIENAEAALQILDELTRTSDALQRRLAVAFFLSMSPQLLGRPSRDPKWSEDGITERLLDFVLANDETGAHLAAALLMMTQFDRSYTSARLNQLDRAIRTTADGHILWSLRGATRTALRAGDDAMLDMMFRLIESPWSATADERRAALAASIIFESQTLAHPLVAARIPAIIRAFPDNRDVMILSGLRIGDDAAPETKHAFFDALADALPVMQPDIRRRALNTMARIDSAGTIQAVIDRDDELSALPVIDHSHRNVLSRVKENWARAQRGQLETEAVESSLWGAVTSESASSLLRRWAHGMLADLLSDRIQSGVGSDARAMLIDLLSRASNDRDPEIRLWAEGSSLPPE